MPVFTGEGLLTTRELATLFQITGSTVREWGPQGPIKNHYPDSRVLRTLGNSRRVYDCKGKIWPPGFHTSRSRYRQPNEWSVV